LALGQERVLDAYQNYGFFARTGIELPAEARGFEPNYYAQRRSSKPLTWPRITLANTGFGQGLTVTPLQLATAYCAIANGGYAVQPTLLLGNQREAAPAESDGAPGLPDGESLLAGLSGTAIAHAAGGRTAETREQILKPETCALMRRWMAEVVTRGTGKKARLTRFTAAGKTGTAQVPSSRGGYKPGAYTASFIGFFPVERPQYVVLVMFGQPRGDYYGGSVAAPVFKSVCDRISYIQAGGDPQ
jgi:stage V sporulation protein D (sporulation-specific penicillin-binding protein)